MERVGNVSSGSVSHRGYVSTRSISKRMRARKAKVERVNKISSRVVAQRGCGSQSPDQIFTAADCWKCSKAKLSSAHTTLQPLDLIGPSEHSTTN